MPEYGWKPSTKRFSRQHLFTAVQVPDVIDLSAHKPKVINQGQVGRCTGCGTGGMISGHLSQLGANPGNEFLVSPDDLYNLGREKEGTLDRDAGAEPYDVLTMAQEYGIIPYKDWPMNGFDPEEPTSPTREAEAIKYPGFTPYQVDVSNPGTALTNILDAMAQAGGTFVNIGTPWFDAWENYSDGPLPMQTATDPVAGGHDTFLFGAQVKKRFFWGQNSWGESFGSGNVYPGCYILPFDMIPVLAKMGMEAEYVTFDSKPAPTPQPSSCKWGNSAASMLNLGLRLAKRDGRFAYVKWR